MKRRNKDYKYEFLPSNLEIIDKNPSPLGSAIIYIITIAVITLTVFSFIFKIDVVITTTGTLEAEDGIKIINTDLTSKIIKINKKEGDIVAVNEPILELEDDSAFQIETLKNEINVMMLRKDLLQTQKSKIRDASIFKKYTLAEDVINELQLEYQSYWDQIHEDEKNHNKRLNKIDESMKKENITEEEIKNLMEERQDTINGFTRNKANENLSITKEYNDICDQIYQSNDKLEKLNHLKENRIITSPIEGTITKLNYNTIGSYVNPSLNIAEVVPKTTQYIVKTKIANRYVSKIKEGQVVTIKIDAYDYQVYGGLEGKVRSISATSVLDESKTSLDYDIEVEINSSNDRIEIKPGMQVSLDIKTDKKKIIDFVFDPIKKTVDEAF